MTHASLVMNLCLPVGQGEGKLSPPFRPPVRGQVGIPAAHPPNRDSINRTHRGGMCMYTGIHPKYAWLRHGGWTRLFDS